MADNYLITGYHGQPHVTAENDRGINAATFGAGRFVLPVGKQFRAEYVGNNTVRMYDGKLMDNGAAAGIPVGSSVDLTISSAGQSMKRNDLIVFQYEKDTFESGSFVVIQGTETSGTPTDPTLTQADLLTDEKATFDQMALWRVVVKGTTISAVEQVFDVVANLASVNKQFASINANLDEVSANLDEVSADLDEVSAEVDSINTALGNHKAYVVETGTSGIWTYRKWSNGLKECWGTYSAPYSVDGEAATGVVYGVSSVKTTYPSGLFSARPKCQYSLNRIYNGDTHYNGWLYLKGVGSASATPSLVVGRFGSEIASCTIEIDFYAIGT